MTDMTEMSNIKIAKGSVSGWISKMREGDAEAIGKLVSRYFEKIATYADERLRGGVRVIEDGEDIAITVLQTITRNSAKGRLPKLKDRDDLWFLMILIAQHTVVNRKLTASKRERDVASICTMTDLLETYNVDLDAFLGRDDSPERLMEIVDCWEELLKTLADDCTREVAKLKMLNYTNREIGTLLEMVPRTVDRKVKLIAQRWEEYFTNRFYG